MPPLEKVAAFFMGFMINLSGLSNGLKMYCTINPVGKDQLEKTYETVRSRYF
jgi:hypothetical protein